MNETLRSRLIKLAGILLIFGGILCILQGLDLVSGWDLYGDKMANMAFGLLKILSGYFLLRKGIKGYFMGIMIMSIDLASQALKYFKSMDLVDVKLIALNITILVVLLLVMDEFKDQIK